MCLYWIQCNELMCAVLYLECYLLWILQIRTQCGGMVIRSWDVILENIELVVMYWAGGA